MRPSAHLYTALRNANPNWPLIFSAKIGTPVTPATFTGILVFRRLLVFELKARMGQTDRQTVKTRNAAYQGGRVMNNTQNVC